MHIQPHAPTIIVLAGPNGTGKTTAAPRLLRDTLRLVEFVYFFHLYQFSGNLAVANYEPVDIAAIFGEKTLIDRAMNLAVRDAVQLHKEKGAPMVVWREGKIRFIPPKEAEKTWIKAKPDLAAAYPMP